jgi:hypothetical protein
MPKGPWDGSLRVASQSLASAFAPNFLDRYPGEAICDGRRLVTSGVHQDGKVFFL